MNRVRDVYESNYPEFPDSSLKPKGQSMAWYSGLLAAMFGNAANGEMSEIREARKDKKKKRQTVQTANAGKPKYKWRWERFSNVYTAANTKSEARAEFKRQFGIDRLPVGAKLVKF